MAGRVLLQRRALAVAALGGLALTPTTVFAESSAIAKRKPIYDQIDARPAPLAATASVPEPEPESKRTAATQTKALLNSGSNENQQQQQLQRQPRGPTPTDRLAVQIGKARMTLYRYAVAAEDKVNETMDCAFNLEKSFTQTLASLAPARETGEKLLPGAVYVLVAAMAGSIVTRNRNILLRATVPLAFGVAAGAAVLPVTMRNVSDLAWKYEQRFPAVADTHKKAREELEKSISFARAHARLGARYVDDKVTNTREMVESWVKQGK